jgi:uncharacterized protein (DUF1697 family)
MPAYVALLRGINVGGHNKLPMQRLRELLETVGCRDIATYIQSGNAVFCHDENPTDLSDSIATAIEREFGFRPSVLVISAADFSTIAEANPYRGQFTEPRFMHVMFLQQTATNPNLERMTSLAADDEQFALVDRAFYLHAPGGIGNSRLAAGVEKCLGVNATARNWRTVEKLQAMIAEGR